MCAYAGTGDVLIVQELLRICSEPVDGESIPATPASSPVSSCCDQRHRIIEFSEKKTKEKLEEKQHGGSKYSFNRIFIYIFIIFMTFS